MEPQEASDFPKVAWLVSRRALIQPRSLASIIFAVKNLLHKRNLQRRNTNEMENYTWHALYAVYPRESRRYDVRGCSCPSTSAKSHSISVMGVDEEEKHLGTM